MGVDGDIGPESSSTKNKLSKDYTITWVVTGG